MGWSDGWLYKFGGRWGSPRYVLETFSSPAFEPLFSDMHISSHDQDGYTTAISNRGHRLTAGVLHTGDWTYTMSELVVGVRSGVDIRDLCPRGQLLQLRMGFGRDDLADYERIFVGRLQDVRWAGEQWEVSIRSVLANLVSRNTETALETSLFHALTETTLDGAYTAGTSPMNVTSTTGAEREGSLLYLIQVHPSGGDPYFLTATGKTATTFTGVSATAVLGTTAVNASDDDVVKFCALVQAHPVDAARKIMCSWDGSNGAFDDLPASWGLGIPDALVDHDDCDVTKVLSSPVVTPEWYVHATEPVTDGLAWLQGWLSPGGFILCERQGGISIRLATGPDNHPYNLEGITDDDIVSIDSYSAWDPTNPAEYTAHRARTPNAVTDEVSEHVNSIPAIVRRVSHLDHVSTNPAEWRDEVLDRIAKWSTRVPEIVDITCTGHRLAGMAVGDHAVITSRFWTPRSVIDAGQMMVIAVEPDWFGSTTRLRLAFLNDNEFEYG